MGGDYYFSGISGRSTGTATGTTTGASATLTAPAGNKKLCCTGVQCSGDAAALVTIESPAATVLWQKRFAAAFTMSETFAPGTIVGAAASALLVKISASTAHCEANIQAYTHA